MSLSKDQAQFYQQTLEMTRKQIARFSKRDAERYPQLRFESSDIEASGDRLTVRGDLTMKGVTKPVELQGSLTETITDPYGRERIGLVLAGKVDRTALEKLAAGEPAPSVVGGAV